MADTVTSQTLFDGTDKAVLKFTNVSDGTGEAAVKKVDVSALVDAPTRVKINKIWYATYGMGVHLLWDATADVLAFAIGADAVGFVDFSSFGGIVNNAGEGITGDLMFTTIGHTAGDVYTIILEVSK